MHQLRIPGYDLSMLSVLFITEPLPNGLLQISMALSWCHHAELPALSSAMQWQCKAKYIGLLNVWVFLTYLICEYDGVWLSIIKRYCKTKAWGFSVVSLSCICSAYNSTSSTARSTVHILKHSNGVEQCHQNLEWPSAPASIGHHLVLAHTRQAQRRHVYVFWSVGLFHKQSSNL